MNVIDREPPPALTDADLLTRLRAMVKNSFDMISRAPAMHGWPVEIEAIHHMLLLIEATLAGYTSKRASDARLAAHVKVANRHGWPGPLPLSSHVTSPEEMAALAVEVRAAFAEELSMPPDAALEETELPLICISCKKVPGENDRIHRVRPGLPWFCGMCWRDIREAP